MRGKEVFAKTVYAEAQGEKRKGWIWVAWVIKNRARANKSRWGGSRIKDVCRHPNQFECWNNRDDIYIKYPARYNEIKEITDRIYDAPYYEDPTGGCDHYNNPEKEGKRSWTNGCDVVAVIGNHVFYKER